ncbi:MAG: DUF1003 domain-containing protein [Alphaproteobacteria bacterium]|nr:DUF1003 domain-containing protein [Alphaproteobacteria bacterium]
MPIDAPPAPPRPPTPSGEGADLPAAAHDNLEKIAEIERSFRRDRTHSDRLSDAIADIAGTLWFVLAHVAAFVVWAIVNAGVVTGLAPFDPYPFVFLTMIVSMEGVLLATFVLIKQNRMSSRADERAHLDLQVGLLTEREMSKALELLAHIAERLDIPDAVDAETREMAATTSLDQLARDVRTRVVERPDEAERDT